MIRKSRRLRPRFPNGRRCSRAARRGSKRLKKNVFGAVELPARYTTPGGMIEMQETPGSVQHSHHGHHCKESDHDVVNNLALVKEEPKWKQNDSDSGSVDSLRAPIGRINGAISEGPPAPSKPFTGSTSKKHVTRGGDYPMPVTRGEIFKEDTWTIMILLLC
eukprot:TRINITY_DN3383_c0_g1_i1.p2 TRINITY_DN3383_c0_g1~~TRINITY_DN3383_c0_g1_i1.p2  ORF type:complete len:162 (+),score=19.05 TRINITY_DN3383_c0_g1_i1:535-1020(+)